MHFILSECTVPLGATYVQDKISEGYFLVKGEIVTFRAKLDAEGWQATWVTRQSTGLEVQLDCHVDVHTEKATGAKALQDTHAPVAAVNGIVCTYTCWTPTPTFAQASHDQSALAVAGAHAAAAF
jgi:hypothetical protein